MASTDITMPASELAKRIKVDVRITGVRVLQVRVWFAIQLLKLAALVAGCGLTVHTSQRD